MLIALLMGQSAIAEPTSEQAVASLAAASGCVMAFAEATSLARQRIDSIPDEALEHCVQTKESAVDNMILALPDYESDIVRDWVTAKLRVIAANSLIMRLERGDYRGEEVPDDVMREIVNPAGRLVHCMRVAVSREMQGVYFGSEWPASLTEQSREEIAAAFTEIGRRSCPASEAAYEAAFEEAMRSSDRRTRDVIRANFALAEVHSLAVGSYVNAFQEGVNASRQDPNSR